MTEKMLSHEGWKALWMSLVGGVIGMLIVSVVLPDEAFLQTLQCDIDQSVAEANQDVMRQDVCCLSPNGLAGER